MSQQTPKYQQVEHHIRQAIEQSAIVDKLPGERTLAKELGVSYMTLRKAIDNLVAEGLLYKIPTKGTFVVSSGKQRGSPRHLTVGYFLDSSITSGISSPYYSLIFNALEKEASRQGYSLIYFSDTSEEHLRASLDKLDGVIATCFPRNENIIQDIKDTKPVVVIDNASADKSIPSVIIDNFNADVQSVDYVCSLGHKRIGFMCGLIDSDVGKNRFAGYQKGLHKNDISFDPALVYKGDYSFKSGIYGAEYYLGLDNRPTAIICANDSMALGAMRKLHHEGFVVPKDMSVIGFDDIDVASQIVPALTTVAAPIEAIAHRSFGILLDLINGKEPESQHIALPAALIVRQSCSALDKAHAAA